MFVYLPIAEMPADALLIFALSAAIGFVSGLVGVGGGFILTPALIFLGIPPAVAAATGLSQVTAASISGVTAHWARRAVDLRMGLLLTIGGVAGISFGVWLFAQLRASGLIDGLITVLYVLLLFALGGGMIAEGLRASRRANAPLRLEAPGARHKRRSLLQLLPWRIRFPISGLYLSVVPPIALGAATGVLSALMGVGGGFLLVPAMIYLLKMPVTVVVGTALLQVLVVTALGTFLQSATLQTVDLVLATLLILGGVLGAPLGAIYSSRLKSEQIRLILGLILALVAGKLMFDMITPPAELYVLERQ